MTESVDGGLCHVKGKMGRQVVGVHGAFTSHGTVRAASKSGWARKLTASFCTLWHDRSGEFECELSHAAQVICRDGPCCRRRDCSSRQQRHRGDEEDVLAHVGCGGVSLWRPL
jgi:hypothetical protein